MKFAFDCDGTITRYPELFITLGRALRRDGHKVYILTGIPRSVLLGRRSEKYPFIKDTGDWYDTAITSDDYNSEERNLALDVQSGKLDNHVLVGIFKRRICREHNISLLFDDDIGHVRREGEVPVFGVARQ